MPFIKDKGIKIMFSKSKGDQMSDSQPINKVNVSSAPSIIASDVRIKGSITTVGEIQLDGIVEGDISCGSLTMGEHGAVKGAIVADSTIIRGKVDGSIRSRTIRLEKTSQVKGDVFHESLTMEAGSIIDGKFCHSKSFSSDKNSGKLQEKLQVKIGSPKSVLSDAGNENISKDKISKISS